MSEYEAEVYEKFSSRVQRQIQSLRVLLESLQAKGKERHWVRHQTSGDLDDAKLIEGLTGEKTIYKKRADQEPEVIDFDIVNTSLKPISIIFNMQDNHSMRRISDYVQVLTSVKRTIFSCSFFMFDT